MDGAASEWLSTRKQGKRKRSVPKEAEEDELMSQDVISSKPLKKSRVSKGTSENGQIEVVVLDSQTFTDLVPIVAKEIGTISEEPRVRSALQPDECDELLYFIEHNYLSSLSALMYSLKDLLLIAGVENKSPLDDETYERFVTEYNRLRGEKDRILVRAKRASVNGSENGTRRRVSAYHIFMKEHIHLVREEHPEFPFGETSAMVAAKWKGMSDEDKAPYVKKAAEESEKLAASTSSDEPPTPKRVTAWQVFFGEKMAGRKGTTGADSRKEVTKSIAQEWKALSEEDRQKYVALAEEKASQPPTPRATKRMPLGWAVFRTEQGKILKEEHPELATADRLKELHARWAALTDQEQAEYREIAETNAAAAGEKKKGAGRRASTHISSGVIGEDEGAVVVRSKRLSPDAFLNLTRIPTVVLVDITLKSTSPYRKFAFAYPVGGLPVPLGRKEAFGMSVEGIIEGLKVFEKAGVDRSALANQTKSLHRTEKRNGKLLGWSLGLKGHSDGEPLLDEEAARWQILFPAYKYVLEECFSKEVGELQALIGQGKQLVLLDMETNVNVYDYSRPVAAAELLRRYLVDQWPSRAEERRLKEAAKPEATTPKADEKKAKAKSKTKADNKGKGKANGHAVVAGQQEEDRDSERVHWDSQVSLGDEMEEEEEHEEKDDAVSEEGSAEEEKESGGEEEDDEDDQESEESDEEEDDKEEAEEEDEESEQSSEEDESDGDEEDRDQDSSSD